MGFTSFTGTKILITIAILIAINSAATDYGYD